MTNQQSISLIRLQFELARRTRSGSSSDTPPRSDRDRRNRINAFRVERRSLLLGRSLSLIDWNLRGWTAPSTSGTHVMYPIRKASPRILMATSHRKFNSRGRQQTGRPEDSVLPDEFSHRRCQLTRNAA